MLRNSKAMEEIYFHLGKVVGAAMCLYCCCGMMCNYLRLVYWLRKVFVITHILDK